MDSRTIYLGIAVFITLGYIIMGTIGFLTILYRIPPEDLSLFQYVSRSISFPLLLLGFGLVIIEIVALLHLVKEKSKIHN